VLKAGAKNNMRISCAIVLALTLLACQPAADVCTPASPSSGEKANPFFAFCIGTHDSEKRTLREQAELLKELGYDGAGHIGLDNLDERIKTLEDVGLRLFQIYVFVNLDSKDEPPYDPRLKRILPVLKGRGTAVAVLVKGGQPSDKSRDAEAVAIIREIADIARKSNVRVVLYPHVDHWLERVEDAVRVAKKVDRANVGVMFNLCHWLKVDKEKNMKPLLRAAIPYLSAVSINGADKASQIQAGQGKWIQPLDSGSFDIYGFLKSLEDLGYEGPVGLQCWGIGGDARDHLERSMRAWCNFRERLTRQ
jgi:sugar phosphate isomerase/epimerase